MNELLRMRLLPAVFVAGVAWIGALGCQQMDHVEYQRETFQVPAEALIAERAKLARVIDDVLDHKSFYSSYRSNMAEPGAEGQIITRWNEEQARRTRSSYQGYRYRVYVRVLEGEMHWDDFVPQNEVEQRQLIATRAEIAASGRVPMSVFLAIEQEVNTRMNLRPGDWADRQWDGRGQDPGMAVRILREIRERYNLIAADPIDEVGELSARTAGILEGRGVREGGGEGEAGRGEGGGGAVYGPSSGSTSSGTPNYGLPH